MGMPSLSNRLVSEVTMKLPLLPFRDDITASQRVSRFSICGKKKGLLIKKERRERLKRVKSALDKGKGEIVVHQRKWMLELSGCRSLAQLLPTGNQLHFRVNSCCNRFVRFFPLQLHESAMAIQPLMKIKGKYREKGRLTGILRA